MKIVNRMGIIGQQGLQQRMSIIRRHLLADEAHAPRHAMHVNIYTRTSLGLLTGT